MRKVMYDLGVRVVTEEVPVNKNNSKSKKVVVDLKNKTAHMSDNPPTAKKEEDNFFLDIRNKFLGKSFDVHTCAQLMRLRLKSIYAECIKDSHFDTDANIYLDSILFDRVEEVLAQMLLDNEANTKSEVKKDIDIIHEAIMSSITMLDYNEQFDRKKFEDQFNKLIVAYY